jgi:hypothetical protein
MLRCSKLRKGSSNRRMVWDEAREAAETAALKVIGRFGEGSDMARMN